MLDLEAPAVVIVIVWIFLPVGEESSYPSFFNVDILRGDIPEGRDVDPVCFLDSDRVTITFYYLCGCLVTQVPI